MTATVGGFGCIVLLLVTRRFGLAFPVHQFPNQPGIVETATSRSYSTTALNQKTNNDSDNDSDNEQGTIVERCFDAFNQRDLNSIMDCFADDCRYEDTLFQGSAVGKQDLKRRFQHALETTNLLLPSSKVIVDNVAWDPSTGKLGARWHIEMDDHGRRTRLPFSQVGRLTHTPILDGIRITNSICWSKDGHTMYLADSPTRQIHQYDYHMEDGTISNQQPFHDKPTGVADGSCVDSDGYVWNAVWRSGEGPSYVQRIHPIDGTVVFTVHMPDNTSQVSCCCFGGKHYDILFITTAWENLDPMTEEHAGGIYAVKLQGIVGCPERRFQL